MSMKKFAIPVSAIALCAIISGCAISYPKIKESIKAIAASDVRDGTYSGAAFLLPVSVKVDVTVRSGRIESIDLLKHFNGQGKPAEKIIPAILARQSLDVDVVAGATHSSLTILRAVESALKKGL